MSSLGIFELLAPLLIIPAGLVYYTTIGIFSAVKFVSKAIVKAVKKRQETIAGLSVQAQELYKDVTSQLNASSDRIIADSEAFSESINKEIASFTASINEKDSRIREKIANQTLVVEHRIDAYVADQYKAVEKEVNSIQASIQNSAKKYDAIFNDKLAQIQALAADKEAQITAAKAFGISELNDVKAILDSFKNDADNFKYADKVAISIIESSVSKAQASLNSGNYYVIQSGIISLNSAKNDVLREMINAHKMMADYAFKYAEYQSNLETARQILVNNRTVRFNANNKVITSNIDMLVYDDVMNIYESIDAMAKKEDITDLDLAKAKNIASEARNVIVDGTDLYQTYLSRNKVIMALEKAMGKYGFDCIGKSVDFSRKGAIQLIKFHNEMDKKDVVFQLEAVQNDDLSFRSNMQMMIFHENSKEVILNDSINKKYQSYVTEILKNAKLCQSTPFSCAGNIEDGTNVLPVNSELNTNWHNVVKDNIATRNTMESRCQSVFNEQNLAVQRA